MLSVIPEQKAYLILKLQKKFWSFCLFEIKI